MSGSTGHLFAFTYVFFRFFFSSFLDFIFTVLPFFAFSILQFYGFSVFRFTELTVFRFFASNASFFLFQTAVSLHDWLDRIAIEGMSLQASHELPYVNR